MTAPGLPPTRWELTAPETYLLRYVDCGPRGVSAFTLAIKELVGRGALRLLEARIPRRLMPGTRGVWPLARGPAFATVNDPALTAALHLYEEIRHERGRADVDGVLLTDLPRRDGRELIGFCCAVNAALRRRGLLTVDGRRTEAGCLADEELDKWLTIGRHDGSRAADFRQGAGAAALLIPGMSRSDSFKALDAATAVTGDICLAG